MIRKDPYSVLETHYGQEYHFPGVLYEHSPFFMNTGPYGPQSVTAIMMGDWTTLVQTDAGFPLGASADVSASSFDQSRRLLIAWPYAVTDSRQFSEFNGSVRPAYREETLDWMNYPSFSKFLAPGGRFYLPTIPESERKGSWTAEFWRQSYMGGYSGVIVQNDQDGRTYMIIAFTGENRNRTVFNDSPYEEHYQNSVWLDSFVGSDGRPEKKNLIFSNEEYLINGNPEILSTEPYSTSDSNFGFSSISILPWGNSQESDYDWGDDGFWDQGVVAWPARGYLEYDSQTGKDLKASSGAIWPFIIRAMVDSGDYVYVFYVDDGGRETGHSEALSSDRSGYGVRVIRAPSGMATSTSSYKIWDGEWTERNAVPWKVVSPPHGLRFSESRYRTENPAKRLFPPYVDFEEGTVMHLSVQPRVAKVRDQQKWIMIEQVVWGPSDTSAFHRLALRVSSDLVNWSNPIYITQADAPQWGGWPFSYWYPGFVNAEGTESREIDPDNFWVIGRSTNSPNGLSRIRLRIDIDNPVQPHLWHSLPKEADGGRVSPWFGKFWDDSISGTAGWYYHQNHGWQIHVGSSQEKFLIWDNAIKRYYYTGKNDYPWINLFTGEAGNLWKWYYYSGGTTPSRTFWSHSDRAYVPESELRGPA